MNDEPCKAEECEPSRDRKWSPPMDRYNNPPTTMKHFEARRQRGLAKRRKRSR